MSIVLFAIIGSKINAGAVYWACFGVYIFAKILRLTLDCLKED